MNIFDRKNQQQNTQTTAGFYFGKSESEGENSYKESENSLFDDYLDILPKINNEGCFIITGRKGSGKSAIAKYIKDNASLDNLSFCEIVKSDAIKLEKQIQYDAITPSEKMVSFFQWIILVKLIKLILESKDGNYTAELKALRNFVKNNSGVVDIDKLPVAEVTELTKKQLNIGALTPFKGTIEQVLGKRVGEKAVYYKFLPVLRQIVYKVLGFPVFKEYRFVIIFDDLDLGFKSDNDQDKKSLLELLRAAKEFNNDLKSLENTKVIVLLRDDIKKVLMGFDADVSKIFSTYEVELKWYDGKDETKTRLREFVNRRIEYNFKQRELQYDNQDPWSTLFNDGEGCYDRKGYKSAFKYILDYTFLRPRDIVLFLKNVGPKKYPYPIEGEQVGELLHLYAKANIDEIKAEFAIHYSQEQIQEIFKVLQSLSYLQSSGFNKQSVVDKLREHNLKDEVFDVLINYYLLIPFDPNTRKYYIGYRDSDPSDYGIDSNSLNYKLHKCIHACFVPRSVMPDIGY